MMGLQDLHLLEKREIQLPTKSIGDKDQEYGTFLHELTHHILYKCKGLHTDESVELFENENLVEAIAGLYKQAFDTMEYDNIRKKK
jgi:hypothetical protein